MGPTAAELTNLRKGWNTWLESAAGHEGVARVRAEIQKRLERFSAGELTASPFDLGGWNGIPDLNGVTAPNVASLMFMVEENGKRLLLTGDSQQSIILKGLTETGFLDSGSIHLTALKVQHHGSEHNLDAQFARTVSADHYIFCGNGEHGNPEPVVLQRIFDSRRGPASKRALAPEAAGRPFTFWFSTAPEVIEGDSRADFEERVALVKSLVASSGGQMKAHFNRQASRTISL